MNIIPAEKRKWRGLIIQAIDKSTLALPECPELFKKFSAHGGCRGEGSINVEICCLFSVFCRIPIAVVFGKSSTSEHDLVWKLLKRIKKGTLLLIDNGFYSFKLFRRLNAGGVKFLIPAATNSVFKVIRKFAPGDYLCTVYDRKTKTTMSLRVIYTIKV